MDKTDATGSGSRAAPPALGAATGVRRGAVRGADLAPAVPARLQRAFTLQLTWTCAKP